MKNILTYFFSITLCIGYTHANAEYIRPVNKMAAEVSEILSNRQFDKLEALAKKLRKENSLLSDGQPEIFAFYSGVSKCVEMGCGDEALSENDWIKHRNLLNEWILTHPSSMTAKLALAKYLKEYGWKKRGFSYAHKIPKEQREEYIAFMEESRNNLEKIKNAADKDPIWYDTLLSILKIQNPQSEEFNDAYKKATKLFPYYLPYYFTKASEVTPKWGGTTSLFTAFVDETVRNTREKLGETMYARLNWSSYDPDMFQNGQADWNRMKAGFIRITTDFPDPWNINNFAKFSCLAGDNQTLKIQMAKIADSPIPAAWRSNELYEACKIVAEQTQ